MPWITAGAIVGGNLIGGMIGSKSSKDAAKAQENAAARAATLQQQQLAQARAEQRPFTQAGTEGIYELSSLLGLAPEGPAPTQEQFTRTVYGRKGRSYEVPDVPGYQAALTAYNRGQAGRSEPGFGSLMRDFTLDDFEKEPGYDFRLSEGEKGVNRAMSARGAFDSGAALKALTRFNQDYASGEYGNAYNRYRLNRGDQFNRLASITGIGQTAVNQLGVQGANTANQMSDIFQGAGNARGAAAIAGGNAWADAFGSSANTLGNWWMQNNMLDKLGRNSSIYGNVNNPGYSMGV